MEKLSSIEKVWTDVRSTNKQILYQHSKLSFLEKVGFAKQFLVNFKRDMIKLNFLTVNYDYFFNPCIFRTEIVYKKIFKFPLSLL